VARDLLSDFGLTPASFSRIDVPTGPAGPSAIDRFIAKKNGNRVTPDDRDLDEFQRWTLQYGSDADKARVIAEVQENRRMFA
jgi:hypothetical protein